MSKVANADAGAVDDIASLVRFASEPARGRRPEFTGDPLVERLFSISLALTAELAVTRERLDTVERALARRDLVPREDIEAYRPDAAEARERGALQADYLARVFRSLLQDAGQPTPALVTTPMDSASH